MHKHWCARRGPLPLAKTNWYNLMVPPFLHLMAANQSFSLFEVSDNIAVHFLSSRMMLSTPVPYPYSALRFALASAQYFLRLRAFFEGGNFLANSCAIGSSQNTLAADLSASVLVLHTSPWYSLHLKRAAARALSLSRKVA